MQLSELVKVSRDVAATRSRLKKRALLADYLERAQPGEIELAVSYLAGVLPQGRIGLGPSIVRDVHGREAATESSLALAEVDDAFTRIAQESGTGSQLRRREILGGLYSRATAGEQGFLARLVLGELRQGALEAVLVEAIAAAAELPEADVRRAVMLAVDPAAVARAALIDGADGLARFRMAPLKPLKPMLAQPAEDVAAALATLGEAAFEYKLDGARVQIHRDGDEVRIFSRALNDVTDSLPEIVEAVRALPARSLILDGEAIALAETGRPLPFQVTMRRFGRKSGVADMRAKLPLSVFLFDCLHVDGDDLIDRGLAERFDALAGIAGEDMRTPRIVTADPAEATAFLLAALEAGHEGLMAKSLASRYEAGNRGAGWLKLKQAHTLDLVVLAAEWGSGRRKGWLSNLHLGARDEDSGGFVMLGKTFKGLTDRMLDWQTKTLLELELGREDHVVHVKPELVVEIAVNEIQQSPQYPAGMALRFARVKRYRKDKTAAEADTLETVRSLFAGQMPAT